MCFQVIGCTLASTPTGNTLSITKDGNPYGSGTTTSGVLWVSTSNRGEYLTNGPTISFSGGGGSGVSATPLCRVKSGVVTSGGSEYADETGRTDGTASVTGPGAVAPTFTYDCSGGEVTAVTITDPGKRITSATLTFGPPSFPLVSVSVPMGGILADYADGTYTDVTAFVTRPAGGDFLGANTTPSISYDVSGGYIVSATVVDGGYGFLTGDDVQILFTGQHDYGVTYPATIGTVSVGTLATGVFHLEIGNQGPLDENILWLSHGSGYTSNPSVTFSSGITTAIGTCGRGEFVCMTVDTPTSGTYEYTISPPSGTHYATKVISTGTAPQCSDLGATQNGAITPTLGLNIASGYACSGICGCSLGTPPFPQNGVFPSTIYLHCTPASCDVNIWNDNVSLTYQSVPSWASTLGLGPFCPISAATFTDINGDTYQYCVTCSLGAFLLVRIYQTSVFGNPFRSASQASWNYSLSPNTCSPFSMTSPSTFSGCPAHLATS